MSAVDYAEEKRKYLRKINARMMREDAERAIAKRQQMITQAEAEAKVAAAGGDEDKVQKSLAKIADAKVVLANQARKLETQIGEQAAWALENMMEGVDKEAVLAELAAQKHKAEIDDKLMLENAEGSFVFTQRSAQEKLEETRVAREAREALQAELDAENARIAKEAANVDAEKADADAKAKEAADKAVEIAAEKAAADLAKADGATTRAAKETEFSDREAAIKQALQDAQDDRDNSQALFDAAKGKVEALQAALDAKDGLDAAAEAAKTAKATKRKSAKKKKGADAPEDADAAAAAAAPAAPFDEAAAKALLTKDSLKAADFKEAERKIINGKDPAKREDLKVALQAQLESAQAALKEAEATLDDVQVSHDEALAQLQLERDAFKDECDKEDREAVEAEKARDAELAKAVEAKAAAEASKLAAEAEEAKLAAEKAAAEAAILEAEKAAEDAEKALEAEAAKAKAEADAAADLVRQKLAIKAALKAIDESSYVTNERATKVGKEDLGALCKEAEKKAADLLKAAESGAEREGALALKEKATSLTASGEGALGERFLQVFAKSIHEKAEALVPAEAWGDVKPTDAAKADFEASCKAFVAESAKHHSVKLVKAANEEYTLLSTKKAADVDAAKAWFKVNFGVELDLQRGDELPKLLNSGEGEGKYLTANFIEGIEHFVKEKMTIIPDPAPEADVALAGAGAPVADSLGGSEA